MKKILPIIVVLSIVITIACSFWFNLYTNKSALPKIDGIVLNPAIQINDFIFIDHEQKNFSRANLWGKWHLMFFGYTYCPDVCPTTLNTLKNAFEKMSPSERELFSVIFVSIDPHRDTPEVLARFLHYFNDDFIGVTADDEILNDFTRQLGMTYTRSETIDKQSEDNYLMDHSSRILMINPHAELQAYLRSPRSPQSLLESVRQTQDFFDRIESHK